MSLYSRLKGKAQETSELIKKAYTHKPKNSIVEHIVSLSGKETEKVYIKHGLLGRGGFANCYITQKLGSDKLMATKVIQKASMKSNRTKIRLVNEIRIHKGLQHPNIVEFYHYFEDYEHVYIMLELCQNESLNELLRERGTLTAPEIQSFLFGICSGVKYLHEKKFIHRDLKLGNIFLNDKFQIKIGDFGLTSQLEFFKENKRTVCGTPNYIAPEVLEGTGYYFQIDVWAIGIILFTLFYGFPPFESEHTSDIYQKIRTCDYRFPKKPEVPIEAIQLIKHILVPQPLKRPTIEEIMRSPFMKMGRGPLAELPQTLYSVVPQKKDLDNLPVAMSPCDMVTEPCEKIMEHQFSSKNIRKEKSTMDKTQSRDQSIVNPDKAFDDEESNNFMGLLKCNSINEKQVLPEAFLLELDLISENVYYFRTNQQVLGIYEKDREICYRQYSAFEKEELGINKLPLYNNLFGEKTSIPYKDFKYRTLLNFKAKQLAKEFSSQKARGTKEMEEGRVVGEGEKGRKLFHLVRVNHHKDVVMVRMNNRAIQVIFDDVKNGFIFETKNERLFYFEEQLFQHHSPSSIKEVKVPSLLEIVKNFITSSKNSAKVPNIMTSVDLANGESLKIPMNKLKHMYDLMSELKNKKSKHGNARCSQ